MISCSHWGLFPRPTDSQIVERWAEERGGWDAVIAESIEHNALLRSLDGENDAL